MAGEREANQWLEWSYDAYPRIEPEMIAAVDESLKPRGPDLLYALVAGMALPAGAHAIDAGCGEGKHSVLLAERFGLNVLGIDPVDRQIELARRRAHPATVHFKVSSAEALPVPDGTVDLVWCRDVLAHVAALDRVYSEFRRVLRPDGHALVYQMFAGDRLESKEAAWLWKTMGVVPKSADPANTERAIDAAGLHVDDRIDVASEWKEWSEEHEPRAARHLLHAARLLRNPQRFIDRFGEAAYQLKLGDSLWHVYPLIGKLSPRIYVLSVAQRYEEDEGPVAPGPHRS